MATIKNIDEIMKTIPERWRNHWCGGEYGPCACLGCVQVGNRLIMANEVTGDVYRGDPEYIIEKRIPPEIYNKYKITKREWEEWKKRNSFL